MSIVTDKMLELGVKSFSADTGADNRPAICFLEKLGFGERKAHVYMSKTLQSAAEKRATPDSRRSEPRNSEGRHKRAASVDRTPTNEKRTRHHGDGSGVIVRLMVLDDIYPVFQLGERVCSYVKI